MSAASPPAGSECIHCGFCLETCPTYLLTGREEESPRGRILLARAIETGRLAGTRGALAPLDHCLGCLACETACPSGVAYGSILGGARARAAGEGHARSRLEQFLVRHLLTRPRRLRVAVWLYRRLRIREGLRLAARSPGLPGAWRARARLAPALETERFVNAAPVPAAEVAAPRVRLFRGCAARVLFPGTEEAMGVLLRAAGYRVEPVDEPECCGALAHHAGDVSAARHAGRKVLSGFASGDGWIVPPAAGCGAHLRGLSALFPPGEDSNEAAALGARIRDLSEALLAGPRALRFRAGSALPVVFQDPCHLRHAQGITDPPRRLLLAAGADLREPEEAEICCGSAGSYHLAFPAAAALLGRRKRDALLATGARVVVTANPGCWVQLRAQWPGEGAPELVSLARFLADRLAG